MDRKNEYKINIKKENMEIKRDQKFYTLEIYPNKKI